MTFGQSISVCFSKYGDFEGRASRNEFRWFYLFYVLVQFGTGILGAMVGGVGGFVLLRVEDKSAEDETKLSRRNLRLSFFNCTDSNACDNYDR